MMSISTSRVQQVQWPVLSASSVHPCEDSSQAAPLHRHRLQGHSQNTRLRETRPLDGAAHPRSQHPRGSSQQQRPQAPACLEIPYNLGSRPFLTHPRPAHLTEGVVSTSLSQTVFCCAQLLASYFHSHPYCHPAHPPAGLQRLIQRLQSLTHPRPAHLPEGVVSATLAWILHYGLRRIESRNRR